MSRSKIPNFIFWATALVALLYSSYRYPFRINSSDTSPTYSDTPPLLQEGKYIILAATCFVMLLATGGFYLRRRRLTFVAMYLVLSVYPIIHFIYDRDLRNLVFPFIALVAFFISVSVRSVSLKAVDAFLKFTLYISIIFNLVQVVLFIAAGRLPALAYEDTLSVRFGSFLDDPNGFGALLFLLLGYTFCLQTTAVNHICRLGVILSIILTQSLTAIIFFGVLAVFWGLKNYLRTTLFVLVVCLLSAPFLFGGLNLDGNGLLEDIYSSKVASMEGHASSFTLDYLPDVSTWVFGDFNYSLPEPAESWWMGCLNGYGVIWTAPLAFMFSAFLWRLHIVCRKADRQRYRGVLWGGLLFSLYVVLASFNLPFPTVFPVNFFFMLLLCLFMLEKLDDQQVH